MRTTYVDQGVERYSDDHHDALDPNDADTILDVEHSSVNGC